MIGRPQLDIYFSKWRANREKKHQYFPTSSPKIGEHTVRTLFNLVGNIKT